MSATSLLKVFNTHFFKFALAVSKSVISFSIVESFNIIAFFLKFGKFRALPVAHGGQVRPVGALWVSLKIIYWCSVS